MICRRARKEYKCDLSNDVIHVGDLYYCLSGMSYIPGQKDSKKRHKSKRRIHISLDYYRTYIECNPWFKSLVYEWIQNTARCGYDNCSFSDYCITKMEDLRSEMEKYKGVFDDYWNSIGEDKIRDIDRRMYPDEACEEDDNLEVEMEVAEGEQHVNTAENERIDIDNLEARRAYGDINNNINVYYNTQMQTPINNNLTNNVSDEEWAENGEYFNQTAT